MALIDVDLDYDSAEQEVEFKPLPENEYDAQVVAWDLRNSQNNEPMILWTLEIINHPEYNGRQLFHNTMTVGKGRNFLTRFAQACGRRWEGKRIDPDQFVGCQVRLSLSEDTYQNKKVNKIDAISSI